MYSYLVFNNSSDIYCEIMTKEGRHRSCTSKVKCSQTQSDAPTPTVYKSNICSPEILIIGIAHLHMTEEHRQHHTLAAGPLHTMAVVHQLYSVPIQVLDLATIV